MAINAIIESADEENDGTVRLSLKSAGEDACGQTFLYVINPPENIEAFVKAVEGVQIWGGSSEILIGQKKWASRIGYTSLKLLCKPLAL